MVTITIDVDNIIEKHELNLLKNMVKPVPKHTHNTSLALTLSVPKSQMKTLYSIPIGAKRVEYINTHEFTESITGYAYSVYDKKRHVCEVLRKQGMSYSTITNELMGIFPHDTLVWFGVSIDSEQLSNEIKKAIKAGFSKPHISIKSPFGKEFPHFALCMIKLNGNTTVDHNVEDEVEYVLLKKEGTCQSKFKLTNNSIKYMKQLYKLGSTMNSDGSITQKEIAGNLRMTGTEPNGVQILDIDHDSLITGHEEGVKIAPGLYNFHSHPRSAYDTYGVKVGWPSAQDYVGFLMAYVEDDTILHFVTSIEGLYVISMNRHWLLNKHLVSSKLSEFILNRYSFCGTEGTPYQYIRNVNKILYEDHPLFAVKYIPWNQADMDITVDYKKNDSENCFTSDKTIEFYNKLYN